MIFMNPLSWYKFEIKSKSGLIFRCIYVASVISIIYISFLNYTCIIGLNAFWMELSSVW